VSQFFFVPHRDFSVSNRFGLFAQLSWHAGLHGAHGLHAGGGGGVRAHTGAHPQFFFPNRSLRRSSRFGLELPQLPQSPQGLGVPQLPQPAPVLTTTGAAGGGGAGSAPTKAADDMIKNAAFTTDVLLESRSFETRKSRLHNRIDA
jgi:hypothetical protein